MIRKRQEMPTFNDGLVRIYTVGNVAEPGNMPVDKLVFKQFLRYTEKTVGIHRYYAAMQAQVKVDRVLRCPRVSGISTQDVARPNDGKQYKIVQVQYPEDLPLCMDISLSELEAVYDADAV